jgi:hypothetical protein
MITAADIEAARERVDREAPPMTDDQACDVAVLLGTKPATW